MLGPWTFPGVEVLGTFHSALKINKSDAPDLQIMVMPLGVSKDNGAVLKESMGISDKVNYKNISRYLLTK